jgi:GDPmannose 4,6-dehydratase
MKSSKQKTALICGVSGQDGSYLASLLLSKDYKVVGTSRDASIGGLTNLCRLGIADDVVLYSMALNDFRSVLQVLSQVKPDEIYNLAGQTSVGLSFEQPIETFDSINTGTLNLLEGLRFLKLNARFYNAGSSECFGNTEGVSANETTAFKPKSPYAVAKAAAFWAVASYREAYGLFACSGILFNHESVLRPERFVTQKIIKAAQRIKNGSGETLMLGNIDIYRDWGWAPEYVDAMWRMLQQEHADDFVIATGESHSLKEFVAEAFSCLDLDWHEHVQVDLSLMRPSDIAKSCGNAAKAQAILGWQSEATFKDIVHTMVEGCVD